MQQPRPQPSVFATMVQEQIKQPRPWVQQELFAHLPLPRECKCSDCTQLALFRSKTWDRGGPGYGYQRHVQQTHYRGYACG